jgi:hypothetical protein
MARASGLTSSTLKPVPDKWIARDGCNVVLNSTPDEIILLRYDDAAWHVTRHPRDIDESAARDAAGLEWCGTTYAPTGTALERISEHDPHERWREVYHKLLSV